MQSCLPLLKAGCCRCWKQLLTYNVRCKLDRSAEGRIGPKTRWRDYGPTVEGEPTYIELTRNKGGSRPKELFIVSNQLPSANLF